MYYVGTLQYHVLVGVKNEGSRHSFIMHGYAI